uniref:Cell wall protein n=1 Tax=Solanum tuberosum TaxID=4113 RepID=A9YTZ6_SOLTU|nr:cell wall protein [Solanum tuberosum]
MGSKAIMFLGLFLAIFLMISSEVAARELAAETSNAVNVDGHYHDGGYGKGYGKPKKCYSCCKKTKYGCKKYCCSYEEYVAAQTHN